MMNCVRSSMGSGRILRNICVPIRTGIPLLDATALLGIQVLSVCSYCMLSVQSRYVLTIIGRTIKTA